jgi:hypothetical protein
MRGDLVGGLPSEIRGPVHELTRCGHRRDLLPRDARDQVEVPGEVQHASLVDERRDLGGADELRARRDAYVHVKGLIQRAVRVKVREVCAWLASHAAERAADVPTS